MKGIAHQSEFWQKTYRTYTHQRQEHWNEVGRRLDTWQGAGRAYHRSLERIYRFLIPAGARVLEIGCGKGDLLAAVEPGLGLGIDFSREMVRRASAHPELSIIQGDAHHLPLNSDLTFDYIILSDLLNDVWDVEKVLQQVSRVSSSRTRLIINSYSRLWEPALSLARRLGWAKPNLPQNWLTVRDLRSLLHLTGLESFQSRPEIIFPFPIPVLKGLLNRYLGRIFPWKHLAVSNFLIARLARPAPGEPDHDGVSIIIPARNEADNIPEIFQRVPRMGSSTELIFVEGHSQDNTYQVIEEQIENHPGWKARLFKQAGTGKGDAVRLGFEKAQEDILMILDADLTVPPETLPRFYQAIRTGKGELINGVRLVYPREDQAMRFLNLVGNKFFSLAFSWLLDQPIKDTLCGTKVISRKHYQTLAAHRDYWGDFDPFGDFELLFGASKHHLKIVDLPIRYRKRIYGSTNIKRWKHGWLLLKMVFIAASRLKFR